MDVNGDGNLDLLSGCYSRHDTDMAGLFYVLYGEKDRTFRKPVALDGSDGQPLILPGASGQEGMIDRICTRPFACDLDGDGYGWGWTAGGELFRVAGDTVTTCDPGTGECAESPAPTTVGKNANLRLGGLTYES